MKLRAAVLTLILLLSTNWPSAGASRFAPVDELKSEAERAFGQALDLWRDGQFAQLYDRTKGGRETREAFARRLIAAPLKPACCWEKMQRFPCGWTEIPSRSSRRNWVSKGGATPSTKPVPSGW